MYEKPVYVNTNIPGSTASLSRGTAKIDTPKMISDRKNSSLIPLVHTGDRYDVEFKKRELSLTD